MFYLKLCNYFSKPYPYFWSYKTKNTLCGIVRFLFFYIRVRASKRGSSVFWSDNNAPKLRSLMKCHTEERRVRRDIKKALVGTEVPSVRGATEIVCQFYWQFIYKSFTPKELSEICTLYLRRSLCRRHLRDIAFISVLSVALCALLYKRFNLSLHISEEPKKGQKQKRGCICFKHILFIWDFIFYSVYNTCMTVWPTANNVFLSICSIVSLTVCHVGPKELCWQSG